MSYLDPASLLLFVWHLCLSPPTAVPARPCPGCAAWLPGDVPVWRPAQLRMTPAQRRRQPRWPELPRAPSQVPMLVSAERPAGAVPCALTQAVLAVLVAPEPVEVVAERPLWQPMLTAHPGGRFGRFADEAGLERVQLQIVLVDESARPASAMPNALYGNPLAPPLPVADLSSPEGMGGLGVAAAPVRLQAPNMGATAPEMNRTTRSDLLVGTLRPVRVLAPSHVPRFFRAEELLRIRRFNQENYIFALQSENLRPRSFWERLAGNNNPPTRGRQMRGAGVHASAGSFELPSQRQGMAATVFPQMFLPRYDTGYSPAEIVYMYGNVSYLGLFLSYELSNIALGFDVAGGVENRGFADTLNALGTDFTRLIGVELSAYGRF